MPTNGNPPSAQPTQNGVSPSGGCPAPLRTPHRGTQRATAVPFLRYARARLQSRLAYPGDVAAQALGDLLVGLVGVLFLSALFARVPVVAGWSLHETLVVWGLAECVTALTHSLFAGAAVFNQRYLLGGELDRVNHRCGSDAGDKEMQVFYRLAKRVTVRRAGAPLQGRAAVAPRQDPAPPPTIPRSPYPSPLLSEPVRRVASCS